MGNLQASETNKGASKVGQKGRSKMRLLGGKKNTKQQDWTSIVPEENKTEEKNQICCSTTIELGETTCKSSSSSNSNFTLALTPAGEQSFVGDKLETSNQCFLTNNVSLSNEELSSDRDDSSRPMKNDGDDNSFTEVFQPLNVFKLNEFRARMGQETALKFTKLGVTTTSQISLEGDGNGFSTGVLEVTEDGVDISWPNAEDTEIKKNKDKRSELSYSADPPPYRRHMSVPIDVSATMSEGLSLQKAPSLSKAELEARLQRPQFVPEKLDFRLYEKFEGYMLINWYLSELSPDSPARVQLGVAELKLLASQFCTHLLAAGVLKQLPDSEVPLINVFRPDCIYFWSHAEAPQSQPQTPGKLNTVFWPPTSSPEVSPNDVGDNSECQTILLKHYKRNSSARDVDIFSLEEEIRSLQQDVEKYKTLIQIQNLTASAVNDFGSPSEENRGNFSLTNGHQLEFSPNDKRASTVIKSTRHIMVQTDKEKIGVDNETQTDEVLPSAIVKTVSTASSPSQDHLAHSVQFSIPNELSAPVRPSPRPPTVGGIVPPPPPPMPSLFTLPVPPIPPPLPPSDSSFTSSPLLCSNLPPSPPTCLLLAHLPCSELPLLPPAPPPPPPPPYPGLPPPPPPHCPGLPLLPSQPCQGLSLPPCSGLPPPPPPIICIGESPKTPSGGPLPMPAPPPGGFYPQKAAMKKAAINPPVPMKPLFWTRILVAQAAKLDDGQPLWTEIEELPLTVVPEDFTKLFSRQVITKIPAVKRQEQKPKMEVVKLLDSKRSQSVGILARSLRQDFHEIENAIYTFDTSVVNLEALQQIYEVRATKEELSLINEHLTARPDVPLDKPEQFLYDLSQIANFAERITCLTFQVEFEDAITTIGHTIDNFKSTCEFLTKSPELKQVLALILTLGNYMNGGNVARGQADGFGLEVLSRLKDVKGAQAGVTLLHFVVSTYTKNFSEKEKLPPLPVPEPGDVRRAMSLDFDVMRGELNQLYKRLDVCDKKAKEVIANSTTETLQPFKDKIEVFLEKSRLQHETECENLEECNKMFITMMKLYLFKPKGGTLETFAPFGFFDLWLQFCADFKDIYKKEIIKIQVERAQELKRKEYHEANVIKERENGLKAKFKKARARLVDKQAEDYSHDHETL